MTKTNLILSRTSTYYHGKSFTHNEPFVWKPKITIESLQHFAGTLIGKNRKSNVPHDKFRILSLLKLLEEFSSGIVERYNKLLTIQRNDFDNRENSVPKKNTNLIASNNEGELTMDEIMIKKYNPSP